MAITQNNSIDQLNSFLRGEMSAVETYRQALEALKTTSHAQELADCKQSHETRVSLLADAVRELGGIPADSPGVWGAFTKAVEGSAAAFGERTAVAALEEGEDHGNRDYDADVAKLSGAVRSFIETRVIPLQRNTHATVSALKKQLS